VRYIDEEHAVEVRHEIEVRQPPDAVFDFLIDTDSFRVVDHALIAHTPEGASLSVGLRGTFVHRRGGLTARTTWVVEELERPSRLRVALRGTGYEMDETALLVAIDGGTRATFVDSVRPTSIAGRVMVALSGAIMRRDLRARAARLKSTLEHGRPA
jgi:hypothetical protein